MRHQLRVPARSFGLALLLAAAVASAATGAANKGTLRVSANYHPGGSTTAEQQAIARTHDLVVLGTGWADNGPPQTYYDTNPNIVAVVYQSWFDNGPGNPDWGTVSQHEDWFYHDASGFRVATYSTAQNADCKPAQCPTNAALCNCRFGMNLGNAAYRSYVATRFTDIVTGGGAWGGPRGFDGVFMDNTFPSWPYRPAKVSSGWVSATPVLAGGATQTEADWVADQQGFIQAMKNAVGANKTLLFNGCSASASSPSWKTNSYAYLQYADGCTMEDWVVSGADLAAVPKTGSAFQQDLDLFQGVNDRGKWSTPLIGGGVHDPGVNRYGIAAALLVWSGPHTTMNFWKGTALEAIAGRFATTFPEAAVDLGTPLATYERLTNGVHSRKFSAGRVLLNATTASQTVTLDGPMKTIEGATVTSVTLASGRAEILLGGSTGNTPPGDVQNLKRNDIH